MAMTDRRRERIRTCLHPGSEEWDDLDALVAERDRYKAIAECDRTERAIELLAVAIHTLAYSGAPWSPVFMTRDAQAAMSKTQEALDIMREEAARDE